MCSHHLQSHTPLQNTKQIHLLHLKCCHIKCYRNKKVWQPAIFLATFHKQPILSKRQDNCSPTLLVQGNFTRVPCSGLLYMTTYSVARVLWVVICRRLKQTKIVTETLFIKDIDGKYLLWTVLVPKSKQFSKSKALQNCELWGPKN